MYLIIIRNVDQTTLTIEFEYFEDALKYLKYYDKNFNEITIEVRK